jgi:hypothetical protein
MKLRFLVLVVSTVLICLSGCAPRVITRIAEKGKRPVPASRVVVYDAGTPAPEGAREIGFLEVTGGFMTVHCRYNEVVADAQAAAGKAGGNALKLLEHRLPGERSGCNEISAKILHYDSIPSLRDSLPVTPIRPAAPSSSRHVLAVGYQLGGYSLLGMEFEVRVHDYIGVTAGIGYRGLTGGFKLHTGSRKNSPFLLVSYKDGGFGLLNTVGFDLGGRLQFNSSSDLALHVQFGLAKVLYIDRRFASYLYGERIPAGLYVIGIGFSL